MLRWIETEVLLVVGKVTERARLKAMTRPEIGWNDYDDFEIEFLLAKIELKRAFFETKLSGVSVRAKNSQSASSFC